MAKHPIAELTRLREIGWRDWDPIGLRDTGCPQDEYDTYLLQVVSRLRRDEPVTEVVEYLEYVGSAVMGLGRPSPVSRKAAEKAVLNIKTYLDTLPNGPLQIR